MSNRAAKYEQLHKSLKKHFKALPEPGERSVLEHLLYACCLEDAKAEQADEAFAKLQQAYFDWNEVRVTTVIELGEALGSLPNSTQAGHRIKRCLQSLFEARYQYDIDDLKKANLSKATEEMNAWKGVSPFILNYVSQNALGGHAIPADNFALDALVACEILTSAEAEKKTLPGVERAIPKNKGVEFASLLHQFAVEFHQHPKNAAVVAVFKDLGVSPKAKPAEKAPAKKESATSTATEATTTSSSATQKTKSVEAPSESAKGTKKPESLEPKKTEKPVVEDKKSKETSAKVPAKIEKTPDTKKKPEAKADIKASSVKSSPSKKPETKPAPKKEEKPAAKDAAKKSSSKDAGKKSAPPPKSSKPIADLKKATAGKKAEPPPSSKKTPPTTTTKKKPR